jgi:putative ABC transport system permease protein
MFKHYLKIALRNATRRKTYSIINISGLAIGMAACILIIVYIVTALSYDRYHENADNIYRIIAKLTLGTTPNLIASTNATPSLAMRDDYPEVLDAARVRPVGKVPVQYEDRQFYEDRILYADGSLLDVFTFPMLRGNPDTALETAHSIVITEETARKYFGDEDPMGKVLRLNDQSDYSVTGILENVPANSHFVFDMLLSFETLYDRDRERMESWFSPFIHYSYVLLHEDADWRELEAKLPAMLDKYVGDAFESGGASLEYFLQPMTSIHLHSHLRHELAPNSDISYVYIFGAIALAILLIACFNFMNLATARSSTRAMEVGVRKVLGADRRELIKQFLAESLLYSFCSLILALILVQIALPFFGAILAFDSVALSEGTSSMSPDALGVRYGDMPWLIPGFIGLALMVGLVAGSYPAFYLASLQPGGVMKGGRAGGSGHAYLRRFLVTLQLITSVVLMIATAVVLNQLSYMKSMNLGFDKRHVVVMPIMGDTMRSSTDAITAEMKEYEAVVSVGVSSHVLGGRPSGGSYSPEGYPEGETEMMDRVSIDEGYVPTLGMEIVQGRNFSREFPADESESILINETAARKFGWDDPIGKTISFAGAPTGKTVVGVVGDFHFSSPHRVIGPIYIDREKTRLRAIFARIESTDIPATLQFLEQKWSEFDPNRSFDYYFLDTSYDEQYRAEENLSKLFSSFTVLAIFIACLGLFGIASFTVERRTKEIGIRKILGSSVAGIVLLLSRELFLLSLVANLIAWPMAYLMMGRWLQDFPFRGSMSPMIFLSAAALMLLISFVTIAFQSIKAGLANPVEALRCE